MPRKRRPSAFNLQFEICNLKSPGSPALRRAAVSVVIVVARLSAAGAGLLVLVLVFLLLILVVVQVDFVVVFQLAALGPGDAGGELAGLLGLQQRLFLLDAAAAPVAEER